MKENKQIIQSASLTQFFFKTLTEVNHRSVCPVPEELILYSSQVLDQYALSENFYQINGGKVNEKVLGMSYLEAHTMSPIDRKRTYKDIGDSVLVQLGLFSDRVKSKAVNESYYIDLGRSSYEKMGRLNCSFYDIPNFYLQLSTSFEYLIKLLMIMNEKNKFNSFEDYLIEQNECSPIVSPSKFKAS